MPMRVTGLTSGLDTESIISALVSAYDMKTQKYTKAQTKLSWTQEAWKGLNTKVYSLYTNVSNLRFSSAYSTKKATVSDATKATVTASGEAVSGTQKLSITSTAQTGYMTGGKMVRANGSKDAITADTKLSELGYTGEETTFQIKIGDKETTDVKVKADSKISEVVASLKEAGVNANFDANQGRFYISSKTSGAEADFTILPSAAKQDADGNTITYKTDSYNALYALGLASQSMQSMTENAIASKDLVADSANTGSSVRVVFGTPQSAEEADAQNALVKAFRDGKFSVTTDDPADGGEVTASYNLEGYVFKDGSIYKSDDTAFANPIASYAEQNISLNAAAEDSADQVTLNGGSTASYTTFDTAADSKRFATKIDGKDAAIVLNDVEYTSSTNSFSINGLSINTLAETDGDITITTATDTQAIYDKIKDFLTEYNSIINEMNKLYNAESSYGYEPLTDDEKDAMSDTEIEKWEAKIKDSLLRNDTTLNGVMMAMINTMGSAYEINGEKYTLSSFGISTLGYLNAAENEGYAYHIDGDSDDENTSNKEDKLMKAITENPDTVIDFMKQLTGSLYTNLGNKMKSTALSSAYTIYNDKEMSSQYSEYSKTISSWQDKLTEKEDYYYNKFSKMEAALTKLQSQTSSLSGLFGSSS